MSIIKGRFSRLDDPSCSLIKSSGHHIGYCRTEEQILTLTYTWEIENFWNVYQLMLPIYTNIINMKDIQFQLNCDSEKQNLDLHLISSQKYMGLCRVFLKNNGPNFYKMVNMLDLSDRNIYICSIPIILLLKKTREYMPNDTLTIYIECEWQNDVSQKIMFTRISESYVNLSEKTKETVLDKESLVTFIVGDKRLYANKNLICAKSTVFEIMFSSKMKKGETNEVKITDVKYDILKLLLSYIQFCLIPDLNVKDVQILSDLFMAADKYNIKDLKILCEFHLIKLINAENYTELSAKICLKNTQYLEKYIQDFAKIRTKCIFEPEVIKLIENSASSLPLTKYSDIQAVQFCEIGTIGSSSNSCTIKVPEVSNESVSPKSPKRSPMKKSPNIKTLEF
ncbi:speckle-type POZ protein-like [Odontomachus brunneus]|uniref:speckle-type POZ protein-like n=1 Tax=Odontomachus brunneus TaxID=486640 RepID=UPI0013F214B7|nr:speckle-type POZ protein-like [Odontomachus brunneus]XP_032665398.1 speckle-type POZ protein-like [Odontomachus brunneus]